jgi:hypothetical protein
MVLALGCGGGGSSKGPADAAATSDSDETPADASSDAASGDVLVENVDHAACTDPYTIWPLLPDEASHLAAARLTPATYPFHVTKIGYDLAVTSESDNCDALLAHKVALYVTDAAAPTPMPSTDATLVATIDVPAETTVTGDVRTIDLTLDTPIDLTTGQHLYVAVEMAANDDLSKSLCIEACSEGGGTSGVNFWSNANAEPYSWADMVDDFGFGADYTIRATGTAL